MMRIGERLDQKVQLVGSLRRYGHNRALPGASGPEILWKGRRYGECTHGKRLDSQMGSQGRDGNGEQGSASKL